MFIGRDFHTIYLKTLEHAVNHSTLEGKFKTFPFYTFELTNPFSSTVNIKKNWIWALHEGINRLSFEDPILQNPGTAYTFRPNWAKKLEKEEGSFDYAYGEIFQDQVPKAIKRLKSKSEREAIIQIWDSKYLLNREKYQRRPCTLTIHLQPYNGQLNMSVHMRTVDIINLLPYDVFHHSLLYRYILSVLGKYDPGTIHFHATFAYYHKKRDLRNSVEKTIEKLYNTPILSTDPDWKFDDTCRLYLIDIIKKQSENNLETNMIDRIDSNIDISNYTKNYAKAILFLNENNLNEFKVLKK